MGRILAIDYGRKRTGLAVTDLSQIIATPLKTVKTHLIIDSLKKYNETESIETFVIGMPKNLQNKDTDNTPYVRSFIILLQKTFPDKPIHEVDERFTSKIAFAAMIAGGMKNKEKRKKENIDKISATIILQSFLKTRI